VGTRNAPYGAVPAALGRAPYEVAGDSFDYALNTDVLHVAIVDSVGHDIESSVISHLVNGSLRNSRRNGRDLPRPTSGPTRR
jgi:serine phosphatase RsbU (regulator of sigma subunit)